MPDYLTGYYDESRLRGGGRDPGYTPDTAPLITGGFTYNNGQHYAGTNVPMSDQAYALLTQNGGQIATDRDVSGTGGVGQSLSSAGKFELDHIGNIFEGLRDEPSRLVFGFDPIGTKIGNAVTGKDYDPLVNQMGGATGQQISDYEAVHGTNSAGGAQGLHTAAAGTAGIIAAGTLANGGLTGGPGGGAGATTPYHGTYSGNFASQPAASGAASQSGAGAGLEEIVVNGTRGGLTAGQLGGAAAGVGGAASTVGNYPGNYGDKGGLNEYGGGQLSMGNAADYGAANNGLVLEGGAGTLPGWVKTGMEYADNLNGLLGSGKGGGGGMPAMPSMGNTGGMMGSSMPSQPARQPLDQTVTRFRGYGRTPLQFKGQTIWL